MITKVPAGEYNLLTTYIGYETSSMKVKINNGGVTYQAVIIWMQSGVKLDEVRRSQPLLQQARTTVNISQLQASQRQIKALPSVGGEADIDAVSSGDSRVISTGDQGGQIYIRGGTRSKIKFY